MPLASVIIPCYNARAYVGEAIRSALAQTYPEKEVIVVDDGSTDDSLDVVRSFGSAVRWTTGPRQGAAAARNRGLRMAQGDWIQFLDADDVLFPAKLQRQIGVSAETGADWVLCDWAYIGSSASAQTARGRLGGVNDPLQLVLRRRLPIESPLHRRSSLERVGGFREELPCAQEFDLHLRLAATGAACAYVPEALFGVRRVPESVSSDYVRVLRQFERVIPPVYEALRGQGRLSFSRRCAFAAAMARAARHAFQRGEKEMGVAYARWARAVSRWGAAQAYPLRSRTFYFLLGPRLTENLLARRRGRGVGEERTP